jgi:hypothetical protein
VAYFLSLQLIVAFGKSNHKNFEVMYDLCVVVSDRLTSNALCSVFILFKKYERKKEERGEREGGKGEILTQIINLSGQTCFVL